MSHVNMRCGQRSQHCLGTTVRVITAFGTDALPPISLWTHSLPTRRRETDDALVISENAEKILRAEVGRYLELKEESIGPPSL
jgi:hypothetical protein